MDVNKADAITPTVDTLGRHAPGQQRNPGADADASEDQPEEGWSDDDAVDVHGLPTGALTPEAQRLIDSLAAQIEPMRRELEQAQARAEHLNQLATIDPALGLPNRREFNRELQHVIDHMASLSPAPALVLIHVADGGRLRRRLGLDAADAAMRHVAELIGEVIHPTDTQGRVGAFDLGVILLNGDGENVALRLESIRRRVANNPLELSGRQVKLAIETGAAVLGPGQQAAQAIAAADRALLAAAEDARKDGPKR